MRPTIPMDLGRFEYADSEWNRFKSGVLSEAWLAQYPQLFDEFDLSRAKNQGGASKRGRNLNQHFFEWQAAIIIHERFGYLSMYEKYLAASHPRKGAALLEVVGPDLYERLLQPSVIFGGTQPPDLFVYTPDRSDWCFCEVKGPADDVSLAQRFYFGELERLTARPIRYARFVRPAMRDVVESR